MERFQVLSETHQDPSKSQIIQNLRHSETLTVIGNVSAWVIPNIMERIIYAESPHPPSFGGEALV